ncbi:unnamed protein product [Rotaria sp. Silwood1]|nr:unnamed protein product [Rotaria sp. Silwood1]
MHKKFRCGLLMRTKDGKIKKLDLENGGGSRLCDWYNKDITLNDVYLHILNIFKLGDTEHETLLYNFQLQPLDVNQYETFFEYIQKNGLNCSSTIIYVCIHEVTNNDMIRKTMMESEKKYTTTTSSIVKEITSLQTRTDLFTTSIEHEHVNENKQDIHSDQTNNSLYEYSFINSINSIMKSTEELMSQNNYNEILIKLFENICIIHGYSHLTIPAIKQLIKQLNKDIQSIKQCDIILHLNCINIISVSCAFLIKLFTQEKDKFDHIPIYSMIHQSFTEFYRNLKLLCAHCYILVDEYNKFNKSSPIKSIEYGRTKSSHSNSQSAFEHYHETNTKAFGNNSRKTIELFKRFFINSRDLLHFMNELRLLKFHNIIQSIIVGIESVLPTINMGNSTSVTNAIEALTSFKIQYSKIFYPNYFTSPIYRLNQSAKQAFIRTSRSITDLIGHCKNYQIPPVKNQTKASTSLSIDNQKQRKNKYSIQSLKRKSEALHVDNYDQSEIQSYSSFKNESFSKHFENRNKRTFKKSN